MKRFIFLLTTLFITQILAAQSADSLVNDIQLRARSINDQLSSCDTIFLSSWEKSSEGISVMGYVNRRDIRLICVTWFGAIGKKEMYYYFSQNKLICALEKNSVYNRPINWDQNKAIENGDSEYYDPLKTQVSQKQYYFSKERLFRLVDADQVEVDLTLEMNKLTGKGVVADAYKWKRELIK